MRRHLPRSVTAILLLVSPIAACAKPPAPSAITFDGGGATDPATRLAHGERLARLLGCINCHGERLQGSNASADDPDFGDMNAPNLSLLLPVYSDAELDKAIRRGIPRDGRTMWFMASEGFQRLGDDDLAAMIAYLRTFSPTGPRMPPLRFGPGFRRAQQTGEMKPAKILVDRFAREAPVDLGSEHRYGRWLAQIVCSECHNARLDGYPEFTPDLDMAANYTPEQLDRLISTGQGVDGRDLEMMADTARSRLRLLTPRERKALIAYLKARASHDLKGGA